MNVTITYAIGDVHGEADRLRQMHKNILDRHSLNHPDAALRIVHLGDYIDRGPDSFQTVEDVIALSERSDCDVINLRGNHEQMLIDAVEGKSDSAMRFWLKNGGDETLQSYLRAGHSGVIDKHFDWFQSLPTLYCDPDSQTIFVHAGIDVEAFPYCHETIRLWTRSPDFFDTGNWTNPELANWRIVHGHTPTDDFFPEVDGDEDRRINLDTGAVFGGRLTAGIFEPGEPVRFMYA